MKTAIYPGSFNPWHEGHQDILNKALKVFDRIEIAIGYNPEKDSTTISSLVRLVSAKMEDHPEADRIDISYFKGLLVDHVVQSNSAVIRGLRNGQDFEYEKAQQYWNEDLGLSTPVVCFISDRKLVHISSSAFKAIKKIERR